MKWLLHCDSFEVNVRYQSGKLACHKSTADYGLVSSESGFPGYYMIVENRFELDEGSNSFL